VSEWCEEHCYGERKREECIECARERIAELEPLAAGARRILSAGRARDRAGLFEAIDDLLALDRRES